GGDRGARGTALHSSRCQHCGGWTIRRQGALVYGRGEGAEQGRFVPRDVRRFRSGAGVAVMLSPIPFVGGLDRDAGSMVARPGSMSDLRNVIVSEGRLIVRSGLSRVQTFVDDNGDPITHICAIHPLRTERVGLVVGYNSVTGKVHIYRTTEEGKDPVLLAREG